MAIIQNAFITILIYFQLFLELKKVINSILHVSKSITKTTVGYIIIILENFIKHENYSNYQIHLMRCSKYCKLEFEPFKNTASRTWNKEASDAFEKGRYQTSYFDQI